MVRILAGFLAVAVVCISVFASAPARTQPATGLTWQEWNNRMMKDLTQEMASMTEKMSLGELRPAQRLQMAQRMGRMSMMMRRMSSLAARPAIIGPERQKRMGLMRKQMDEMLRDSRMTPHG